MSRRSLRNKLATSALLAAGFCALEAGCNSLIGLGDEPKLRPADVDASVLPDAAEAAAVDAPVDTSVAYKCGLVPHPNPVCKEKVYEKCCTESIACAAESTCKSAFDCIFDCAGDRPCTQLCLSSEPTLQKLVACSSPITECLPSTPECIVQLSACCRAIPSTPESNRIAKDNCNASVLRDDPDNCKQQLGALLAYCPSLDAGSDASVPLDAPSDAPKDVSAQ